MGVLTLPFLEAIAVGCLSGLVGTLMVLGNRVFFAESLSHGTFPGAVLGVVVGMSAPIHGARATRAARARELEAENAETKAHAEFHAAGFAHSAAGASKDASIVEESAPQADKA